MNKRSFSAIVILCAAAICFAKEKRVALVIGNGSYDKSPVSTAQKDAADVTALLKENDFKVGMVCDASHADFVDAIKSFGTEIADATVGLFYYAGQAVQVGGKNYLIPVHTEIKSEDDIVFLGVPLNDVLTVIEQSGCAYSMLFIDAGYKNQWQVFDQSGVTGLAFTATAHDKESIIMFSANINETIVAWNGDNSLFASKFISEFKKLGTDVRVMCGNISALVKQASDGTQIPWTNSSITSEFVLMPQTDVSGQTDVAFDATSVHLAREQQVQLPIILNLIPNFGFGSKFQNDEAGAILGRFLGSISLIGVVMCVMPENIFNVVDNLCGDDTEKATAINATIIISTILFCAGDVAWGIIRPLKFRDNYNKAHGIPVAGKKVSVSIRPVFGNHRYGAIAMLTF